jgi:hypothetical protein
MAPSVVGGRWRFAPGSRSNRLLRRYAGLGLCGQTQAWEALVAGAVDPEAVEHPQLREFARQAVWVAKLAETAGVLEDDVVDLLGDAPDDGDLMGSNGDCEEEPLEVALEVVSAAFEDANAELEGWVAAWLAADPEHWPIFRLVVLDPWQTNPGQWQADVPGWVRTLGTLTTLAHFQRDPYGRQRTLDIDGGGGIA